MKFRNHSKGGNLFSSISHQQNMAKRQIGILKLKKAIDWSKGGNLPFDPLLMFKILILQSFHGLSDEATEF